MLAPPLESEIALAMAHADPDAINAARVALIRSVQKAHGTRIRSLYDALASKSAYSPDAAPAGRRALRNALLRYLTAADDEAVAAIAEAHYRDADNMTDMIAGLAALSRMESPRRENAFAHFHDRFRGDALVLDKWMALQAGSPRPSTVEDARALMKHPHFDIKNPNRVRSLVGAFSGNHLRFHAGDGQGYALVGETVRALDGLNPKMSAGMASAFENWRRYDAGRQALMRAELEKALKTEGISPNLFEVATKILG
jgi:aminopeptidase N